MRTHFHLLRAGLAVLLVGTGCLFAVGSTIERNHRNHEKTAAKPNEVTGVKNGSETAGEGAKPKPSEQAHSEAGATILGVNTESVTLSVLAVIASLLLAAAIWLRPTTLILLAVVAFGLVFAAGDGRELVHQLDDANSGLAAAAALLLALHLVVNVLAAMLVPQRAADTQLPLPED